MFHLEQWMASLQKPGQFFLLLFLGRPKITMSDLRDHVRFGWWIRGSGIESQKNPAPCLHQKRLQKVGEPEAFRISIHHGEQSRLHWHHHP